jgi:ribosomal-protein-alanine N-acetyltransferase
VTADARPPAEMGTVVLGPMWAADAARCAELERALFPGDDPWSERAFREELRAGCHYVVARLDGSADAAAPVSAEVVGYAGIAFVAGPPQAEAEVHTIGVDPARQGRGIGRALLRALLDVADAAHATVFLEVRTDNAAAKALYASEGFAVVGLRRRYYQPSGADAHTMRRDAK